jgi:hypothetical protein
VELLAAAPDRAPGFTVLPERDPSQPLHSLDNTVRLHLANNRCVILQGQHLDGPAIFCKDEIEAAKGSLMQQCEWQGKFNILKNCARFNSVTDAKLRALDRESLKLESDYHKTTTLQDFLDMSANPDICGNLLDVPSYRNPIPSVIWFVRPIHAT